ncbi:LOG family protein YvdD [Thalassoglobus neptunius]|uniref:Cytokinin riboside 5'-monophosphate phosphoribohydrolase n=1 Tax=Thalassoglobus neptunius TaxID=1938619 RepID=A0A5C5VBA2_9PLAN|nr:TIGR00730 family Rossman fold protein [Thalassoglobus neptunius]TWT34982.1 LOG family protein YvdD [Thalassoglobus neptunius]
MSEIQSVCVFCGSRTGHDPAYASAASELGKRLAESGRTLVFGGGHIGLMGVVANATLEHGGSAIGVIPESLQQKELAHSGVQDMRIVDSMHTRKAMMADEADAFIALPGGLGTFEELCEILTWAQLGFHRKPVALLNVNGYYDHLIQMIDHGISEGFMLDRHRKLVAVVESVDEFFALLATAPSLPSDEESLWEKT